MFVPLDYFKKKTLWSLLKRSHMDCCGLNCSICARPNAKCDLSLVILAKLKVLPLCWETVSRLLRCII